MMTTAYVLALYEHDDTAAVVLARDGVAIDPDDAPECDAYGWDHSVGETVEIDGIQCRLTCVSGDIQTGDARGNYVEAIATEVEIA